MTTNFRLQKPPSTAHNGKENNSLVVQNSMSSDPGHSSADLSSHDISKSRRTSGQDSQVEQKRANSKRQRQLPPRPHTTFEEFIIDNVNDNSQEEPFDIALKAPRVFEYQVKEKQNFSRREDEIKKVSELLKDKNPVNFHSVQHRNGTDGNRENKSVGKQFGNHTALDLRHLNEDLHNYKVGFKDLQTLGDSHRGRANKKKSRTRPETQMHCKTRGSRKSGEKLLMPESITHEQAIRQEFSANQLSKEIIGRKVGAPNVLVTTHLSKEEDHFNKDAHRDFMIKDMIGSNIGNRHPNQRQSNSPQSRQNLSCLPEKYFDRKRKNDAKLASMLPGGARQNRHKSSEHPSSKGKVSKSHDQIKQTASYKQNLYKLAAMKSKQKQISLMDYLDSSLAHQDPPHQTLNILTATGDQFMNKQTHGRDKSQSVAAPTGQIKIDGERKHSNDKDRSLIQTKYLNFQRDVSNKKSNSHSKDRLERKKRSIKALGGKDSNSNSRSRSKDRLSKEASRDRNLTMLKQTGQTIQHPSGQATQTHSRDSNLRKKQMKASNNLLALINHSKKQKGSSMETVNVSLKNMASPGKKRSIDDKANSGSSAGQLVKKARINQSLSPRNLVDKYTENVPNQVLRSQNLLSKNVERQSLKNVARSAPGLQNMASIEMSAINSSLLDREFVLNEGDDSVSIFRNAKTALDFANKQRSRKKSQSVLEDASTKVKPKSRSPNRDKQNLNSKPGASKIDKLIRENLKKQVRKDLEQKEKDRQIKLEKKQKKLELEQANERMRRQNESQVMRSRERMQKLQMNKYLQNLANSGLTSTVPLNEKTLDANLQNFLARTEKDEITAEMTKLLAQIDERPLYKRLKTKSKEAQTQLQTQKFEGNAKLENIEQLESLLEIQSYLNGNSEALAKAHDGTGPQISESQLLNKLRKKDDQGKDKTELYRARDHRRSHGLDFFDMRKEVLSELKQLGPKFKKDIKKNLKATIQNHDLTEQQKESQKLLFTKPETGYIQLRGSISQRQLIEAQIPGPKPKKKPLITQKKANSIFQALGKDAAKQDMQSEINASFNDPDARPKKPFTLDISKLLERANIQQQELTHAPMKKTIIRRFMKEKQKQITQEAVKQKQQEIKKTLKVHANLVKLNNYCKKQLLNTTGRGPGGIQLTNKISMPSVHMMPHKANLKIKNRGQFEQRKSDLEMIEANDLTITPNRMLFEDSEPSLNVSGTRISRGGTAAHNRKEISRTRAADTTDDLYEDSKMQSINQLQTLEERPINSLRGYQRNTQKRQNKFQSGLDTCFEKSSSARTLRIQVLNKKSQSPPKPVEAPKKINQSMVAGNTVKIEKGERGPQLSQAKKRKLKAKKRGKSIIKGSGSAVVYQMQGGVTSKASLNKRLNVKIPGMRSQMQRRSSSVGTLESGDDSYRSRSNKRRRFMQPRNTSSVKKRQQDEAALTIQRVVRRYLNRLGFYEAREILSPDRQPQINLFIEQQLDPINEGRKSSKSRSGSRSSGKKKYDKKRSPARHGGRHSRLSPDQKATIARSSQTVSMQKTTIIAEISGFKQRMLPEQEKSSSEAEGNLTFIERHDMDTGEIGAHDRVAFSPTEDRPEAKKQQPKPQIRQPKRQEPQKPVDKKKREPFAYNQIREVPVSESVSILDRLQGTSAANNFSKDEQSNAFMPTKQSLFDKQMAALKEESKDNRNEGLWLPITDQMKSVQTPKSVANIPYLDCKSHKSVSIAPSASVSDVDGKRKENSMESRKSSAMGFNDVISQSSSSVFDRNAFQQFTNSRRDQEIKQVDYHKLIKFREDSLRMREHKEKKHIQKLLKNNQCSPRTYHAKKEQIDRWINVEKMEIEKTKVTFQQEWDKTVKMIEETQKSVDQIRSKINVQPSNTNSNNLAVSSITSAQKPNGSSMGGSAKKQSILLEDPPKSYRSNHLEAGVQSIEKASALSSHRSVSYGPPAENLMQYMEKRLTQHDTVPVRTHDRPESERVPGSKRSLANEEELDNSRFRDNSGASSEYSQQPSAEFLERLEKVKRQEQERLNLNLDHLEDGDLEGKLIQLSDDRIDMIGREFAAHGLNVEENDFLDHIVSSDLKIQESLELEYDQEKPLITKHSKLADLLEGSRDEFNHDVSVDEPHLKTEPNFLNEPAINSNNEIDKLIDQTLDQALVEVITKEENLSLLTRSPQTREIKRMLADAEKKEDLADLLTETIIEALLKECVSLPVARSVEKLASPTKKESEEEQKDQNVDVFLVDSHLREKEEKKEWIEIRQRHLIENDLIRIDQYINEIVDSLLQFEIDLESQDSETIKAMSDNYHIQFLKQLTQPIQKEPTEILQALQTSEIGSYKHFETTQDIQKHPIIPVDLYLDIEKAREEAMIQRKGTNVNRETQLLWESIHIQNKSFFDAVNESLMKFRPYGLTGEPMPWSNKIRRLQTKVDISSVDTERLFQMVKQEAFRWAQTYCGCLPSPIFAFPSHKTRGQEDFHNELFQEFREKRQTQVLWTETVEQEHHWLNFDYEEAQVKIDLSDMILEHLVDELVDFMAGKGSPDEESKQQQTTSVARQAPPPTSPFDALSPARMVNPDAETRQKKSGVHSNTSSNGRLKATNF